MKLASAPTVEMTEQPLVDVWVQFHGLPPNMMTLPCVRKCAEKIGNPATVHPDVARTWGTYARLKVNINASLPLKSRIEIARNNVKACDVIVHYEKIQKACLYCGLIGHEIMACDKRNNLLSVLQSYPVHLQQTLLSKLDPKLDNWVYQEQYLPFRNCPNSRMRSTQQPTRFTPRANQPGQQRYAASDDAFSNLHSFLTQVPTNIASVQVQQQANLVNLRNQVSTIMSPNPNPINFGLIVPQSPNESHPAMNNSPTQWLLSSSHHSPVPSPPNHTTTHLNRPKLTKNKKHTITAEPNMTNQEDGHSSFSNPTHKPMITLQDDVFEEHNEDQQHLNRNNKRPKAAVSHLGLPLDI